MTVPVFKWFLAPVAAKRIWGNGPRKKKEPRFVLSKSLEANSDLSHGARVQDLNNYSEWKPSLHPMLFIIRVRCDFYSFFCFLRAKTGSKLLECRNQNSTWFKKEESTAKHFQKDKRNGAFHFFVSKVNL